MTLKCTKCGREFSSVDAFKSEYVQRHGIGPTPQEIEDARIYYEKEQQ